MAAPRRWLGLGLVAVLAACSQSVVSPTARPSSPVVAVSPQINASPIPTGPAPSPTPTPPPALLDQLAADPPGGFVSQIQCTGDIGQNDSVALVELQGTDPNASGEWVMRDYANPAKPRTVCAFGKDLLYPSALLDSRHLALYACDDNGCHHALVDLPEARYHWFELPDRGELVALSPNVDEVAWISTKPDGSGRRLHLTRPDGDHEVASLRDVLGRCGSPDDSKLGEYTRSGDHLYVLDVPIANDTVFVVLAGLEKQLTLRPPPGGWHYPNEPAMPVWTPNGEALYFRSGGRGWRWTPDGGREPFAPANGWRYPTISPDGRYLAWAKPRDDGSHDIYLMNLDAGGAPQRIARKANTPVFLNDRQLWFVTEGRGVCGFGADERKIYDVADGTTAPSILRDVRSVWPATSSNF